MKKCRSIKMDLTMYSYSYYYGKIGQYEILSNEAPDFIYLEALTNDKSEEYASNFGESG